MDDGVARRDRVDHLGAERGLVERDRLARAAHRDVGVQCRHLHGVLLLVVPRPPGTGRPHARVGGPCQSWRNATGVRTRRSRCPRGAPAPDDVRPRSRRPGSRAPRLRVRARRARPDLADLVERHWVVRWDLPPGAEFTQVLVPHPVANVVAEEPGYVAHGIPPGLFERTLTGSGGVVGTKLRPGAFRVLLGHPDAVRPGVQVPPRRCSARRRSAPAPRRSPSRSRAATRRPCGRSSLCCAPGPSGSAHPVRRATSTGWRERSPRSSAASSGRGGRRGPRGRRRHVRTLAAAAVRRVRRREPQVGAPAAPRAPRRGPPGGGPGPDLAALATAVGYYDQAHLGADFARATGVTPGVRAPLRGVARALVGATAGTGTEVTDAAAGAPAGPVRGA